jgi:transmembrane sensor
MTRKYLAEELLNKYVQGTCSEEEIAMLESWHLKELSDSKDIPSKETILLVNQRMRSNLSAYTGQPQQKTQRLWPRLAYVASALFLISIGTYIYIDRSISDQTSILNHKNDVSEIRPGTIKATLTLSDGKKILLDNTTQGLLAKEDKVSIRSAARGALIYSALKKTDSRIYSHILETPKGGQYQVDLSDGTKVWLNASSSLTYPSVFKGKERYVELTGEAYFEVAKDKSKPFKVKSGRQVIEVLGTHFNVFAYPDDKKIQTVLLEGSIKISKGNKTRLIRPGQLASTVDSSDVISTATADLEKSMAWKNNEFIFNGENLETIMKSVSRWYNIEIVYKGNYGKTKYWGVVSRNQNLSAVLKMLQLTGKVSFSVEGRRVTVMN